jgi:hypothetical protein
VAEHRDRLVIAVDPADRAPVLVLEGRERAPFVDDKRIGRASDADGGERGRKNRDQ